MQTGGIVWIERNLKEKLLKTSINKACTIINRCKANRKEFSFKERIPECNIYYF